MTTAQQLIDLPENTPVCVISAYESFEVGDTVYRFVSYNDDELSCYFSSKPDGGGARTFMSSEEVELIRAQPQLCEETPLPGEELELPIEPTIYRPVLETRKAGKVRVELVDDGFPLALREIAKVMTWAQTAKGYKDHDWQKLPNAQEQLAAAASRHRTDQIMMHVIQGKPLLECVDPESSLVHKAHEAFGVLAQLELMLRQRAE